MGNYETHSIGSPYNLSVASYVSRAHQQYLPGWCPGGFLTIQVGFVTHVECSSANAALLQDSASDDQQVPRMGGSGAGLHKMEYTLPVC